MMDFAEWQTANQAMRVKTLNRHMLIAHTFDLRFKCAKRALYRCQHTHCSLRAGHSPSDSPWKSSASLIVSETSEHILENSLTCRSNKGIASGFSHPYVPQGAKSVILHPCTEHAPRRFGRALAGVEHRQRSRFTNTTLYTIM